MYRLILLSLAVVILSACGSKVNTDKSMETTHLADSAEQTIQYTDAQLEAYLDSIGQLPELPSTEEARHYSDSVFYNQTELDKALTPKQFHLLKAACISEDKKILTTLVQEIFGGLVPADTSYTNDYRPVVYYSFDKDENTFNKFAITFDIGGWESTVFFFSKNRLIAAHKILHRYDLEIEHFKDEDNRTVIYYKECYESGSGVWWFNYYFYKYDNNKLIPVLNTLENSNLQIPWHFRNLWYEAEIERTKPLTMKIVYYQNIADYENEEKPYSFINDSTLIRYNWDKITKTYKADYSNSKIKEEDTYTYYLNVGEQYFIQRYYNKLKAILNSKDEEGRKAVLFYLQEVGNNDEYL